LAVYHTLHEYPKDFCYLRVQVKMARLGLRIVLPAARLEVELEGSECSVAVKRETQECSMRVEAGKMEHWEAGEGGQERREQGAGLVVEVGELGWSGSGGKGERATWMVGSLDLEVVEGREGKGFRLHVEGARGEEGARGWAVEAGRVGLRELGAVEDALELGTREGRVRVEARREGGGLRVELEAGEARGGYSEGAVRWGVEWARRAAGWAASVGRLWTESAESVEWAARRGAEEVGEVQSVEVKVAFKHFRGYLARRHNLKCVEVEGQMRGLTILWNAIETTVTGDFSGLSLSDLNGYPFDPSQPVPQVFLHMQSPRGLFRFTAVVGDGNPMLTFQANDCVVDWQTSIITRLIEYIMYDIVAVFLPSILPLAQMPAADSKRIAIQNLSDVDFPKVTIQLDNVDFRAHLLKHKGSYIQFLITNGFSSLSRQSLPLILNLQDLPASPLLRFNSDVWRIRLLIQSMRLVEAGQVSEPFNSAPFTMKSSIDYPSKHRFLQYFYKVNKRMERMPDDIEGWSLKHFEQLENAVPVQRLSEEQIEGLNREERESSIEVLDVFNIKIESDGLNTRCCNKLIRYWQDFILLNILGDEDDLQNAHFRNEKNKPSIDVS
jgi:hypothetical protein